MDRLEKAKHDLAHLLFDCCECNDDVDEIMEYLVNRISPVLRLQVTALNIEKIHPNIFGEHIDRGGGI